MKKNILKQIVVIVIGVFMIANVNASVTEIDGTEFINTIEIQNKQLHLRGVAVLTYLIFIEAYAGALYLPNESEGTRALDDIAKRLELEYRVAISADDFAVSTRQKIKESVSSQEFNRLLPKIKSLNRLYRSVEPGDRYALVYVPGEGTRLIYNTTLLGTIKGAEFAKAMFGIWIGKNPIDKNFRDRLLGKAK